MSTPADFVGFLRARLDDDERVAREALHPDAVSPGVWTTEHHNSEHHSEPNRCHIAEDRSGHYWSVAHEVFIPNAEHMARHDPARVLAEVDAKRRILAEHEPEWRTVEWPHDQNGRGEAQVCRRCQNAEHTEWHPAWGEAGVLPEGFVAPYVLAPCVTLRLLALPYADHPDYRDEWRPA